jgi:competence protein ComEA
MRLVKYLTCLLVALSLAAPTMAQKAPDQPKAAPAATKSTPPATAAKAAQGPVIDINKASKEELDALPGLGEARSEAIIKGRPYKRKDELVRKKIIPENVYKDIKDRIVAHAKG